MSLMNYMFLNHLTTPVTHQHRDGLHFNFTLLNLNDFVLEKLKILAHKVIDKLGLVHLSFDSYF